MAYPAPSLTSNKLILSLLAVLSWAATTAAQDKTERLLRFTPATIEIGTVRFDGGPVKVTFEYENISGSPVSILDVRAQCGCTAPEYSHSALAPGKKGKVEVTFDPSQTFGEQKRYLTVVASNGTYRKLSTIQVHGYVERDQTESEIRFPVLLGEGIRTELGTIGLRMRKAGETVSRSMVLYNDSDASVRLSWKGSRRVKGMLGKKVLAPGERTTLEFIYKTKGLPSGDFTDELFILAGGKKLSPVLLKGTIE